MKQSIQYSVFNYYHKFVTRRFINYLTIYYCKNIKILKHYVFTKRFMEKYRNIE